jgi:hypothetical protein
MRYGNDDKVFLDPVHLSAEFEVPFEFPHVESLLVWGDPAVGGVSNDVHLESCLVLVGHTVA